MRIAIIGGGLSGTLVTYYLLNANRNPLSIYLFEKDNLQLSRGIAYRNSNETHLLNVPAGGMNIYSLPSGDFFRWLVQSGYSSYSETDFVPRYLFGDYLKELFEQAIKDNVHTTVNIIHDEVVDTIKEGHNVRIVTKSGQRYQVSEVVLANGILPPADPFPVTERIALSGHYQGNPWSSRQPDVFSKNQKITLIGTGLTMLDYAVGLLNDERGFSVTAFSRRGFLPLPHQRYEPYDFPNYTITPTEDIVALLRSIRSYYAMHKANGLNWRALIDRIRGQAPQLWQALSDDSKKRFIRHLKPYWEIHRHRAPQKALTTIRQAMEEKKFHLLKGRIQRVVPNDDGGLVVKLVHPAGTTEIKTDYLLNSSGLQQDISLTSDPLLKNLLERQYMIPDQTRLGVETDKNGALICHSGIKNIFTLGALRRAAVFECTAAKEISEQAYRLSEVLGQSNLN